MAVREGAGGFHLSTLPSSLSLHPSLLTLLSFAQVDPLETHEPNLKYCFFLSTFTSSFRASSSLLHRL